MDRPLKREFRNWNPRFSGQVTFTSRAAFRIAMVLSLVTCHLTLILALAPLIRSAAPGCVAGLVSDVGPGSPRCLPFPRTTSGIRAKGTRVHMTAELLRSRLGPGGS